VQCVDDPSECPSTSEVNCVTCKEPDICDARTRRCQAPATLCENDLDCPGDQLCDRSLPEPICAPRQPDCLDDLLDEPRNDTIATARLLEPGAGPRFGELKLCPANQDWYRLDVAAGTYLTIDARFRHADGDIELQLFLPDGRSLIDESRSTTDNERVQVEVGTELTVYLRVFLARPSVRQVPYELVVARDPGMACADDGHEPDDIRGQAKALVASTPYEGRICAADPDWFLLSGVRAGTRVRLDLRFADALGDLDLEVYRADSAAPVFVAASLDDDEALEFDATFAGDYFVRVFGKAADTNVYTLRAELEEGAAPTCADDRFEPNQGPTSAVSAAAGAVSPADLTLCSGDEDWFRVQLQPGEALMAEIGFDARADLDLRLYPASATDAEASPLEVSDGVNGRELIAFRSFTGGDFLLRVYAPNRTDASAYQLRLEVLPQLFLCEPDANDLAGRGQALETAADMPFPPSRSEPATICAGDSDFYRVFFAGGFLNVFRLSYIVEDAELDFEVLDPSGAVLFDTGVLPRGSSFKEVTANIAGAGFALLYVRVYSSTGFEGRYHLTHDLQPTFSCFPDRAEPNDERALASFAASSTITPVLLQSLSLCASARNALGRGDEDWFRLVPPRAGARIEARITFPQGDLSLELFSPNGGPRACRNQGTNRCFSDGNGLTETVTFTATTTAPYLLKVSSAYSSPQVFVRPASADTGYELRIDYSP
jgi:hypothetical protein